TYCTFPTSAASIVCNWCGCRKLSKGGNRSSARKLPERTSSWRRLWGTTDEGGRAPTFRCFNIFSDISMSDISRTDSRDSVENYCSSFHPRTGKHSKRRKDLRRGKRQRDGCEGGEGGCSRMDRKNERKEEENHARSQSQERKTITMATAAEKHMMQRREGETKQKGGVSRSAGRQQRREE
ncbi:hypothetical protein XENOCAPTIV_029934, partial [Xenoophorus captivus]